MLATRCYKVLQDATRCYKQSHLMSDRDQPLDVQHQPMLGYARDVESMVLVSVYAEDSGSLHGIFSEEAESIPMLDD